MKANEAPENNKRKAPDKIYACFGVFGLIQATEIMATSKDIEYIRKDAFIEKASEWLSKHAIKYYLDGSKFLGTDELVEDFKIAMTL